MRGVACHREYGSVRSLMIIAVCAGIGAALGYSQILCPNGQCALTGSWQGGALLGGVIGMMFSGGG